MLRRDTRAIQVPEGGDSDGKESQGRQEGGEEEVGSLLEDIRGRIARPLFFFVVRSPWFVIGKARCSLVRGSLGPTRTVGPFTNNEKTNNGSFR